MDQTFPRTNQQYPLEQKKWEIDSLFFDQEYGCYVNDELISSKAIDAELQTPTDRKAGWKGPTVFVMLSFR